MTVRRTNYADPRMPTLRDLIAPLFRYRRAAALVFLAVMAATVTAAALATRSYEARMKILVKRERMDPIVTSDPQAPASGRVEVSESELYSEVELLTSRDLLEQVATSSGLVPAARPNDPSDRPDARLARAARKLRGSLDVVPLRKTTIISVAYRSTDPEVAARVLDQLSSQYLAKHLALHRPAGARQFFTEQVTRAQQDLTAAEARLQAFGAREHVVSATGERESTMQKVAEFEATLQQTEAAIADASRRMTAIDAELASTPARHVTQVRDGSNMETLRSLKNQLLQLELKRSELLTKFTPQYLPVVQADADIKQLQAAIAEAERSPMRDETTDQNPTYQWLSGERARVRTERDALTARAAATRRTVALYRERAQTLDDQSVAQQDLIRQVKTAEANLALYQRKQEEARISDELDRTRIANVAIAEPPTVPQSARSSRSLILMTGSIIAFLLALATAYVLQGMNPYFSTPDEVYRVLDVPVLASLPAAAE
jgi:uncharacterized protein involved in exopolysaccharide biosynthesis